MTIYTLVCSGDVHYDGIQWEYKFEQPSDRLAHLYVQKMLGTYGLPPKITLAILLSGTRRVVEYRLSKPTVCAKLYSIDVELSE